MSLFSENKSDRQFVTPELTDRHNTQQDCSTHLVTIKFQGLCVRKNTLLDCKAFTENLNLALKLILLLAKIQF